MRGTCIFCHGEISSSSNNDSLEHIIPNCIGGKLKTKGLVCKKCNSELGKTLDKAFCDSLLFMATISGIERERGEYKPIKGIGEDGLEYILDKDLQPRLARPYVERLDNGKYSIIAPNEKTARKIIKDIYKKYKNREPTQKEIKEILKGSTRVSKESPTIRTEVEIDLQALFRGVTKIAYEFAYFKLGNLKLTDLEPVRNYILDSRNSPNFRIPNSFCDFLPSPYPISLSLPWPHIISLFSYNGSLLSYIKLFSFEFIIDLHITCNIFLSITYATPTEDFPCKGEELRIEPHLGNLFPRPLRLQWEIFKTRSPSLPLTRQWTFPGDWRPSLRPAWFS